jgi:hypothetical protein
VTDGNPIAVAISISGVSAINPLVAFYDIHESKRELLFFYFVPDTTREYIIHSFIIHHNIIHFIVHYTCISDRQAETCQKFS